MSQSPNSNSIILIPGRLVIYQRSDVANSTWHCRIKIADLPYIRRSLKVPDEQDARTQAQELYNQLKYRHERGLSLFKMTFGAAADSYFANLESQIEQGRAKASKLQTQKWQAKYMLEYFGDIEIDQITDAKVIAYGQWRKTYWSKGPGKDITHYTYERGGKTVRAPVQDRGAPTMSTWNKEASLFRSIFKWAQKSGWIAQDQIPNIESEHGTKNRRPAFDAKQTQKIIQVAYKRYVGAGTEQHKFGRALLYGYVSLLTYSGMRPFEAMDLRWHDFDFSPLKQGHDYFKIRAKGKGENRERDLVTSGHWLHVLQTLQKAHLSYREDLDGDTLPNRSDYPDLLQGYVFCHTDGKRIRSFKVSFKNLLKAAHLTHDKNGNEFYDYSFRHFYATEQLAKGKDIYLIAKNMGTSVKMIEDYYGHVTPEKAAIEIIRETEKQAFTKSDNEHTLDVLLYGEIYPVQS